METSVSSRPEKEACIVTVGGEVDLYSSPALKTSLIEADGVGWRLVIVDLSGVSFIDSAGLGVLVGALRRAREDGGELALVCDSEGILKILRLTGLDRVFPLAATVDKALETQGDNVSQRDVRRPRRSSQVG
jgi:anti-sigma B factor antagonist